MLPPTGLPTFNLHVQGVAGLSHPLSSTFCHLAGSPGASACRHLSAVPVFLHALTPPLPVPLRMRVMSNSTHNLNCQHETPGSTGRAWQCLLACPSALHLTHRHKRPPRHYQAGKGLWLWIGMATCYSTPPAALKEAAHLPPFLYTATCRHFPRVMRDCTATCWQPGCKACTRVTRHPAQEQLQVADAGCKLAS